jgi:L-lactate dehydrogenase (cytochrome)
MSFPFHMRLKHLVHLAMCPAWTAATLSRPLPTIANFLPYIDPKKDRDSQLGDIIRQRNAATWEQLAEARRQWPGKFVVKGILDHRDAERCVAGGADGVIVSNHGGRQFDAAPAAVEVSSRARLAATAKTQARGLSGLCASARTNTS